YDLTRRRDDRDAAGDQCRDADVAGGLDRQAVEALEAGQAADAPPTIRCRERLVLDLAGLEDVKGEEAGALGIGDINGALIRRQPDAVRGQHRVGQLGDLGAVRQRVIEPAMVTLVRVPLAEIGEVEPALAVEHNVVRRRQFVAVAFAVENARLDRLRIDALDRAALVIGPGPGRQKARIRLINGAAVVADIERAVGPGRNAVRPAAGLADLALAAVRRDPRHLPPGNLAEDDRAVGHRYRPFRKAEIARQHLDIGHSPLRLLSTGFTLSAPSGGRGRGPRRRRGRVRWV